MTTSIRTPGSTLAEPLEILIHRHLMQAIPRRSFVDADEIVAEIVEAYPAAAEDAAGIREAVITRAVATGVPLKL